MKRRDFLAASALVAAGSMCERAEAFGWASGKKQYLELRNYEFASAEKQKAFEDFLGAAAIPSLNRQGVRPIGVFKHMDEEKTSNLWVLIPHNSMESVIRCNTKMLADKKFNAAGNDILNCPKDDPAYSRFVSSLMLSFDKCPKVEIPSKKDSRIFQLRIYESHNAIKAQRKVEMFNNGGEMDVFRDVGMNPVFFGESIIGTKMPNLTYMLGFDDVESKEKAWKAFGKDPRWQKLRKDPYYKGAVSNITNLVLRPSAASQI